MLKAVGIDHFESKEVIFLLPKWLIKTEKKIDTKMIADLNRFMMNHFP
jgi:hypothetical protein